MIKHNSPLIKKSYLRVMNKCLLSNKITTGDKIHAVENFFQNKYYKSGYACLTSSGTSALYLALKALSLNKSANILVPTYSCSAILNAIYLSGNRPVISDIDINNLNFELIKKHESIDIVIAVNIFGSEPNIKEIKKKYPKAKIILDSCHSIGKRISKNDDCYKVDFVIHSFYATKIITCGHGGLIWSKSKKKIDFCKDYINFDNRKKYYKRFNFLLTDFQATLLLPQLRNIKEIRDYRKNIFVKYSQSLPENVKIFSHYNFNKDIIYRSVLIFKNKITRDTFLKYMKKNNIECKIPIQNFELLHNYLLKKKKFFVNSEIISNVTLSLPMHLGLSKNNLIKICKLLKNFK